MKISLNILYIMIASLSLTSCYSIGGSHLYDKVGQDPQDVLRSDGGAAIRRKVPNYYYHYGPTVPTVPNQAPQYQPAYPPQQQYSPYATQGVAGSRFYSNPYDIPPSPYYNQPYDSDQYYVPPSYYYQEAPAGDANNPNRRVHY